MRRLLLALAVLTAAVSGSTVAAQTAGSPVAVDDSAAVLEYKVRSGDTSMNAIGERLCGAANRTVVGGQVQRMNPGAGTLTLDEVLHIPATCPGTPVTTTTTSTTSTTSTTTTTTAPATTTTTTVPATTTTVPATTTTTAPATTTTTAPATTTTTTAPPAGVAFFEPFETSAAMTRFDFAFHSGGCCPTSVAGYPDQYPSHPTETGTGYHADHDMACGNPNQTHRTIAPGGNGQVWTPRLAAPKASGFVTPTDFVYYCAPGDDPAKGHFMTAITGEGYYISSFSPKQVFTDVRRVCIDASGNDLGGGKWWGIVIVPEATFNSHPSPYPGETHRMDYIGRSTELDDSALPLPADSLFVGDFRGATQVKSDQVETFNDNALHVGSDKAPRFTTCIEQITPTTLRVTKERPSGTTSTFNVPGTIPTGRSKVIFVDDAYNPDKHDGTGSYTLHWDNIEISS